MSVWPHMWPNDLFFGYISLVLFPSAKLVGSSFMFFSLLKNTVCGARCFLLFFLDINEHIDELVK